MANTSISSLVSEATLRLGNRQDIPARVLVWLNYALYELTLSPRFHFYELDSQDVFTTTPGTADYILVNDIPGLWQVYDMVDTTNNRTLRKTEKKDIDRVQPTLGQPVRYARYGFTFTLDPTPDAAYFITVRIRFRPPALTSIGSSPIGPEWDEVLVTGTVIKGLQAFKLWDEANAQKIYFEQLLASRQDGPLLDMEDADFGLSVTYDGMKIPGSL